LGVIVSDEEIGALLVSVPDIHLHEAQEICNRYGRVAFGSNAFEFFRDLEANLGIQEELPVLIYVSRTGSGQNPKFFSAGRIPFTGRLVRWSEPSAGKHPEPNVRPKSTLDSDTKWAGFWEVKDLTLIGKQLEQIQLTELRTVKSGKPGIKLSQPPEGPLMVILAGMALTKFKKH
jgi:hypothetical protein